MMDSAKGRKNYNFKENDDPLFSSSDTSREEIYLPVEELKGAAVNSGKAGRIARRIFFSLFIAALGLVLVLGVYLGWKIHSVSRKIIISNESSSLAHDFKTVLSSVISPRHKILAGEKEGRINIMLLGISGEKSGKNLTDTILIISINTNTNKVAFLSLPRDFYATLPDEKYSSKINTFYQHGLDKNEGIEPLKSAVENITGIPIQYWAIADFEGFKKIIDNIGGINVQVERDIYDPRYPGPNYSYETFEIKKGLHHMDGDTALKYARERHADPEGDFGRARRQQQVIQAAKNKAFSLQTFLNVFTLNKLLNTLESHFKTNIELEEMESFLTLSKNVDSQNVITKVVDAWEKESLLKVSHIQAGDIRVFILIPRVGNYSEIRDLAQNIFDLDAIAKRREEITKEEAKIAIINQSGDKNLEAKIQNLLKDKLKIADVEVVVPKKEYLRTDTIILDKTSNQKLFTLDELIKKLPATLSEENIAVETKKDYDFIVILGKDLAETYKYEEDSMEDYNKAQEEQTYQELMSQ